MQRKAIDIDVARSHQLDQCDNDEPGEDPHQHRGPFGEAELGDGGAKQDHQRVAEQDLVEHRRRRDDQRGSEQGRADGENDVGGDRPGALFFLLPFGRRQAAGAYPRGERARDAAHGSDPGLEMIGQVRHQRGSRKGEECDEEPGDRRHENPPGGTAEPLAVGIGIPLIAAQADEDHFGDQLCGEDEGNAEQKRQQQIVEQHEAVARRLVVEISGAADQRAVDQPRDRPVEQVAPLPLRRASDDPADKINHEAAGRTDQDHAPSRMMIEHLEAAVRRDPQGHRHRRQKGPQEVAAQELLLRRALRMPRVRPVLTMRGTIAGREA